MINIIKNYERLKDDAYSIDNVFRPREYDWPGDYEGRALLAFNCHYEINKKEISTMHKMVELLPSKTNDKLYFGNEFDGTIVDEQQLSGHNWYLRGLLKYADNFNNDFAMDVARSTVENLYLPAFKWFNHYPLLRDSYEGGVEGTTTKVISGWRVSTDIGCAFMCVDGLSKYYQKTKDSRVKEFLDNAIGVFEKIDLSKYKFQTHTTLSCLRGILTLYQTTNDVKYLNLVKEKYDYYLNHGMTLNYENFNWFSRENTWTEPCAIVDSFILSVELYELTKEECYKTLSRRIWFNGLQFCQRVNGGAGTNSCVTIKQRILKPLMYEALFCCTMRYAEGLLYYSKREEMFIHNPNSEVIVDEYNRHFVDDKLLVEYNGKITPIFSLNEINKEKIDDIELKIIY